MTASALPELVLAYYGDDFTGSTDVMEVLALAGLPVALFLEPPGPEQLARFAGLRAVGVAGDSRTRSPVWMDEHLPAALRALNMLRPALVHYKVCSTFDSAPGIGSIGRALELGRAALDEAQPTPIVAGAPPLKRYCVFGNLFARVDRTTYRLDRHPTMSRHPVTPMDESDLRRHLARQTQARVELFDLLAIADSDRARRFAALLETRPDAVLLDVLDLASMQRVGELVWETQPRARFCLGSSGLEYALVAHWRNAGMIPDSACSLETEPSERAIAVSGSCSPATAAQLDCVQQGGWHVLHADAVRLAEADEGEVGRLLDEAGRALATGRSVAVATARGPDDPAIARFNVSVGGSFQARERANQAVGAALGRILRELMIATGVRRGVVAGGDTSSAAARALGIEAVTMAAPVAPGSPLCRTHAPGSPLDGAQIAFKGGQTGGPGYFEAVRLGRAEQLPREDRRMTCLQ
jgi:uncharacterized protein YgbK (DUF1537 family)